MTPTYWNGLEPLTRGHIVALEGEAAPHVVLECDDEQGAMPRILVKALDTGLSFAPTERVERELVKPIRA